MKEGVLCLETSSVRCTVKGLERSEDSEVTVRVVAIGPERTYVIKGHAWTVCEVVDPITLTPVLIFTSAGVGRRVRNYPPNWRNLSGDELQTLSWSI